MEKKAKKTLWSSTLKIERRRRRRRRRQHHLCIKKATTPPIAGQKRDDDGRRVRRRHERALVGVEVFLFAFVVVVVVFVVVAQKNIFKYDDTFGFKLSPKIRNWKKIQHLLRSSRNNNKRGRRSLNAASSGPRRGVMLPVAVLEHHQHLCPRMRPTDISGPPCCQS